jgi:hypothetical protein
MKNKVKKYKILMEGIASELLKLKHIKDCFTNLVNYALILAFFQTNIVHPLASASLGSHSSLRVILFFYIKNNI